MVKEFQHPALHEEVAAVSGRYSIVKEDRIAYEGREVFYLVGVGSFDASCCGEGGCAYALCPGFMVQGNVRIGPEGRPVSLVEPVTDPRQRREIENLLRQKESLGQVNFI